MSGVMVSQLLQPSRAHGEVACARGVDGRRPHRFCLQWRAVTSFQGPNHRQWPMTVRHPTLCPRRESYNRVPWRPTPHACDLLGAPPPLPEYRRGRSIVRRDNWRTKSGRTLPSHLASPRRPLAGQSDRSSGRPHVFQAATARRRVRRPASSRCRTRVAYALSISPASLAIQRMSIPPATQCIRSLVLVGPELY